jgi:hypothetical protein
MQPIRCKQFDGLTMAHSKGVCDSPRVSKPRLTHKLHLRVLELRVVNVHDRYGHVIDYLLQQLPLQPRWGVGKRAACEPQLHTSPSQIHFF